MINYFHSWQERGYYKGHEVKKKKKERPIETTIQHSHIDTLVLIRSPKLSNIEPGQYQIGDNLRILGAVRWETLTPPCKNCKNLICSSFLMCIYQQLGTTYEFDILMIYWYSFGGSQLNPLRMSSTFSVIKTTQHSVQGTQKAYKPNVITYSSLMLNNLFSE